ncbi:hypothetical protein P4637_14740 [Halalkalibacterium halodurans]|uniref:hypothetical protein n=1 Tax=Halalkalibacterium halodurans TaxID=86665 RepID=UPI002E1DC951|nr:hypothetical protein [Halalkalibacterium halodurans]MED4086063.1 hypothetical protein [Halalkalibacterium halodurans]MED4106780.1 hypothetical protein [Halalkalibacterium halodurans]MED4109537.1 hypothetical protein [Halalkalibacterium halodurans]MED4149842.1 hypothetical protein [Halalkalibacterium halodurans]
MREFPTIDSERHGKTDTLDPVEYLLIGTLHSDHAAEEIKLNISFEGKLFHNFYALKECWWQLRELINRDVPELKAQFSSELLFLFPEDPTLIEGKPLAEITAGSSERRLSRESEQIFRIVWGIARLLYHLAKTRRLNITFYQLAEADRVSLQFIRYLSSILQEKSLIKLYIGEIPTTWQDESRAMRKKIIEEWKKGLVFNDRIERSLAVRPMDRPMTAEEQVALSWITEPDAVTHTKVEEIVQHFIMWGNYEAGMTLVEHGLNQTNDKENLSFFWMKKGLTNAFCGNFSEAMDCYEMTLTFTNLAQRKSAVCMYLALLASKRLGQEQQAQAWIEKGFKEANFLEGKEADIEKGWLCNVRALSAFRENDYPTALHYSQEAFKHIKAYQGGDALHLKVNVLSNLSVLFEEMTYVDKALATWRKFESFVTQGATEAFTKVYFFRLGALQIKSGDRALGLSNIDRAYLIAKKIDDAFHACFIAQELALYACQDHQWEKAIYWLNESAFMARLFGDNHLATRLEEKRQLIKQGGKICDDGTSLEEPLTKIGRPFYPIHIPNPL